MSLFAQLDPLLWYSLIFSAAFWGFAGVWTTVAIRLAGGEPVLPYEPRRPVPWRAADLVLVLAVYLLLHMIVLVLAQLCLSRETFQPVSNWNLDDVSTAHTITKLVKGANIWILIACGFSAVIVAPITEEFLFRLVLQGGLESAQRRWRRSMPVLRRLIPGAIGPILLVSFLFAGVHFRVVSPPSHPAYMVFAMIGNGVASTLTMVLAVLFFRSRIGATAADLGWDPKKLLADVRLGVLTFLGVYGPMLLLQAGFTGLLPEYVAADPFPLFFFALALGILYYRTHRLAPAIALHMALNLSTMVSLFVLMP